MIAETTKACKVCGERKRLSDYYERNKVTCKACYQARARAYRKTPKWKEWKKRRLELEKARRAIARNKRHEQAVQTRRATCPICGIDFEKSKPNRVYCSRQCAHVILKRRVVLQCEMCGKTFERRPCDSDKHKVHYCSPECQHGRSVGACTEIAFRQCACGETIASRVGKHVEWCAACRSSRTRRDVAEYIGSYGAEWPIAVREALNIAVSRMTQQQAYGDPWKRRMSSIVASIRIRLCHASGKRRRSWKTATTWEAAMSLATQRATARLKRQKKNIDNPWIAKMEAVARNWRRKGKTLQTAASIQSR
jgi:hypothetical protein